MPLSQTVLSSKRNAIRSWLVWFAKQKPLLSPEQQRAEVEHFVAGLGERDLGLAQLERVGGRVRRGLLLVSVDERPLAGLGVPPAAPSSRAPRRASRPVPGPA